MVSRQAAHSGNIPLDEDNTCGEIPVTVRFASRASSPSRGRSPGKPLLGTDAAATAVLSGVVLWIRSRVVRRSRGNQLTGASPPPWRLRHSARSSVYAMGLFSHEEFRDPDEGVAGGAGGGAIERARRADVDEFGSDDPVVVGPGSPPEDGSCGQFAVQFHVSTSMLAGLTRIAGLRGVSVPEVCRQVVGVFVAQQEGELGALLAAEAEVAGYRPSLDDA